MEASLDPSIAGPSPTGKTPHILARTPLMALAVVAYGIGTSEFIIMGLLPNLAAEFNVTIPKAEALVTGTRPASADRRLHAGELGLCRRADI